MYPFCGEFAGGEVRLSKRVEQSIKVDSQHMVFSAESVSLITRTVEWINRLSHIHHRFITRGAFAASNVCSQASASKRLALCLAGLTEMKLIVMTKIISAQKASSLRRFRYRIQEDKDH